VSRERSLPPSPSSATPARRTYTAEPPGVIVQGLGLVVKSGSARAERGTAHEEGAGRVAGVPRARVLRLRGSTVPVGARVQASERGGPWTNDAHTIRQQGRQLPRRVSSALRTDCLLAEPLVDPRECGCARHRSVSMRPGQRDADTDRGTFAGKVHCRKAAPTAMTGVSASFSVQSSQLTRLQTRRHSWRAGTYIFIAWKPQSPFNPALLTAAQYTAENAEVDHGFRDFLPHMSFDCNRRSFI
jgi:hypothetical protein